METRSHRIPCLLVVGGYYLGSLHHLGSPEIAAVECSYLCRQSEHKRHIEGINTLSVVNLVRYRKRLLSTVGVALGFIPWVGIRKATQSHM